MNHDEYIKTYYCDDKCCKILIKQCEKYRHNNYKNNYKKAGVFIYDPKEERVLLVQSRGHLFGCPKGSLKIGESDTECAIREVKEETGLDISQNKFTNSIRIKNKSMYYYTELPFCEVTVQKNNDENDNDINDANGITWIKVKCLENAIKNGNITLNHYAKIVFEYFLNKTFSKTDWTLVTNNKNYI